MVWTRILLLFGCFGSGPPKALDASFWCLTFPGGPPKVLEAHLTLNAFRRQFRRQRFGIVRGRCIEWFGHESGCCSAVSEAVRRRLWTLVFNVWHFIAARQRFWKLIQHLMRFVAHSLFRMVFAVWHFIAARQRFWKLIQLLMRFVGNVSALFVVAVSHGLDTNPAAVRLFRKRLAKGFGR